jgi:hypothetical protein
MKWINVIDGLPHKDREYFVFGYDKDGWRASKSQLSMSPAETLWWWIEHYDKEYPFKVTHWMNIEIPNDLETIDSRWITEFVIKEVKKQIKWRDI